MRINIRETKTQEDIPVIISKAIKKDIPSVEDGWLFDWKKLHLTKGADVYKLTLDNSSKELQGLIILQVKNDEMLVMKDVEIAPHNLGSKGKYEKVAGCLIAFACKKSFDLARGNYKGFLLFESKTDLIPFYQKKYGASLIAGQQMFIDEITGKILIEKYLT